MKSKPNCIVITRDKALRQKLEGYLGLRANLDFASCTKETLISNSVGESSLLLLDLRLLASMPSLQSEITPQNVDFIIGLGERRSEPALEASRFGINQIVSLNPERLALQSAVEQAHKHLLTKLELASLKANLEDAKRPITTPLPHIDDFGRLTRSLQHLSDAQAVFKQAVEMTSETFAVPRIALYIQDKDDHTYTCRATLGCDLAFFHALPLPRSAVFELLKGKGHLLSKSHLQDIEDTEIVLEVSEFLNRSSMDVIVPLFGPNKFIGWLMLGRTATGKPINDDSLIRLMAFSAKLGPVLESAIEIEKANLKKKLLENLFQALPTGIVAVNAQWKIQWLNAVAERLLDIRFQDVLGQSLPDINSDLNQILTQLLHHPSPSNPLPFRLKNSAPMEIRLISPNTENDCIGHLLLIEDASVNESLRIEREKVQRSELLADISADISQQIRSPLTAIKTFSQLLPELLEDRSFYNQFSQVMSDEVARLDDFTNNIATVSKLTQNKTTPSYTAFSLDQSLETARCLSGSLWKQVSISLPPNLPLIHGNSERLGEAFYHLIVNASDSISDIGHGKIVISAQPSQLGKRMKIVEISVIDNRPVKKVGDFVDHSNLGSNELINRADLRLSIATQIVHEMAGTINLKTYDSGVCIKLLLPVKGENE